MEKYIMHWYDNIFSQKSESNTEVQKLIMS